jgi:hypothetical protein
MSWGIWGGFGRWPESLVCPILLGITWICRGVLDFQVVRQFVKVSLKFTLIIRPNRKWAGYISHISLRAEFISVEHLPGKHLNSRHFIDRPSIHAMTSEHGG